MNFSENLIKLRHAHNMSQEALAEKLGVSRQTIYKWENGVTYPDMDKVVDISRIFNVTVDSLINEGINSEISKEEILKKSRSYARGISFAVLLILIGVSIVIGSSAFNDELIMYLGLVLMLGLIFSAVLYIILIFTRFNSFKKMFDLELCFSKQEIMKEHSSYTRHLVLGVGLIFLGVLTLIASSVLNDDFIMILATSFMMLLIGVGVMFLVYTGIIHELYTKPNQFLLPDDQKPKSKYGFVYPIIMLVATIAFIICEIIIGSKYSWLCFAIGGICCGIFAVISGVLENKNKKQKEIE